MYGFEKKDVANIKPQELEAFRELAQVMLGYTRAELARYVEDGVLFRVEGPEDEANAEEVSQ